MYAIRYATNQAFDYQQHSHEPRSICEYRDAAVLWNQWVQMGREILANRPNIIV